MSLICVCFGQNLAKVARPVARHLAYIYQLTSLLIPIRLVMNDDKNPQQKKKNTRKQLLYTK